MHPSALLDLSTQLLKAVMSLQSPADGVVSQFFRHHRMLGQRERHALAETAYKVLRQRPLLLHLSQSGHGSLERRLAALAWQGEPKWLRAALGPNELQWMADVQAIDRSSLPEKLRHNLPDWLAGALHKQLDGADFWALAAALDEPAQLDLRVNLFKAKREDMLAELKALGLDAQPTAYSPWGIRLGGKPAINRLALFNRGDVEVQDEGSQLLAALTDAKRGEMVVDFCAGAGGKTLALGASMRNTGRLYAFDVSGHRLDGLKPRLQRSGLSNVHPAQLVHERDDRVKRLAGKIQRVLVDAPCSGLGTVRRNPDLKWRQGPKDVAELAIKQAAILSSAARLVASGGRLVYATCSLLPDENEAIAEAFAAEHPEFELLPVEDALTKAQVARSGELVQGPYLRLWPHRHGTDGFFAAAWQRR